MQTTTIKDD
uniref:Uncharacterized protein n=1 Tax=Arundo donax TaxID=35708 RepID=A0A0A8ZJC6_ARUDO